MTTLANEAVNDTHDYSDDAAVEAFLNRWADADDTDQSSNTGEGENSENHDEDDATDLDLSEDESEEGAEADADGADEAEDGEDEGSPVKEAGDDHLVTVTVDGETKRVPVKDLKRLFGQEASLTRKSQEVAAARKAAEQDGERYVLAAGKLIQKAEARFAPFAKIDWMVAQQRLTPDEFSALRTEAKEALEDLNFLKAEADEVLGQAQTARQASFAEAAKESIKVLEAEVPGWNREVYDKVRAFAVSTGMDANVVNTIIDPAALKMFHMAMRLSELKAKAKAKKATAPKATAPKRVVKASTNSAGKIGRIDKAGDAVARLRKSGSDEDAVAALMSRWADNG